MPTPPNQPLLFSPIFADELARLIGSDEEVAIERAGHGYSTYSLHGKVVGVDKGAGTVRLLRTRTHAGEVHEMGLRYLLTVTRPSGETLDNDPQVAFMRRVRARDRARELAVEIASEDPDFVPSRSLRRSRCEGPACRPGSPIELPCFLFVATRSTAHRARVHALSQQAADGFMARLDIYMPLDNLLPHAVAAGFSWPVPWHNEDRASAMAEFQRAASIAKQLEGLPWLLLSFVVRKIREAKFTIGPWDSLDEPSLQELKRRGAAVEVPPPSDAAGVLRMLSISNLRALVRETGSGFRARDKASLTAHLAEHWTPQLHQAAVRRIAPRWRISPPAGMSDEQATQALVALRWSIHVLRKWLTEVDAWEEGETTERYFAQEA